jgi:hypothetical protein
MPDQINISEVVASFYSDLKSVAADLNVASDELGKCIAEIDAGLKTLNLGITVWVEIRKGHGDFESGDESYWGEEIGYAKWSGRWGICLRKTEGDVGMGEERTEMWLFNEAPRALRLEGVNHLVTLLQKLNEEGVATAEKIREKITDAHEVADAISKASRPLLPRRPASAGFQVKGAK